MNPGLGILFEDNHAFATYDLTTSIDPLMGPRSENLAIPQQTFSRAPRPLPILR